MNLGTFNGWINPFCSRVNIWEHIALGLSSLYAITCWSNGVLLWFIQVAEGERFFENSGLLGDDIRIADPLVYNHYVETNLSPAPTPTPTISIGYRL